MSRQVKQKIQSFGIESHAASQMQLIDMTCSGAYAVAKDMDFEP